AARLTAGSFGRRVASAALAMTRCLYQRAARKRLAKWSVPRNTRSATVPMPLPSSSRAACGTGENERSRAACDLYPFAVLRSEVSLLRLQQPCSRPGRYGALDPRLTRRSGSSRPARARARGQLGVFRRRHTLLDAASDRGGLARSGTLAMA